MPRLFATCAFAWATAAQAASPSGPLTAEELFRATPLGEARLSPDGKRLGTIVTDKDDLKSLLILDLKDFKPSGLRAYRDFDISTFRWLGDDRVVFSVSKEKLYSWGLYSARLDKLDRFTPIDSYDATQIVGLPLARPGSVLVWIVQNAVDNGRPGELLELDAKRNPVGLATPSRGDATIRSYRPPTGAPVVGWVSDRQGDLALCETWSNGNFHFYRYRRASDSWSEVRMAPGSRPMGFDYDNRLLWIVMASPERGYELRRDNLDTGELGAPVLADPQYDIGAGFLHFSERERGMAGVTYVQRKPVTVWFSRDLAAAQAAVDQRRPGTDNILVDQDRADRKFLFQLTGAQHPPTYELLDLDTKTLRSFANVAPWLNGRPLRPVQPMSFVARDGARLEGYLALPEGASAQHTVPLVVLAHGGPWVRDVPSFNPEVQFLVSRGYAVLQPNYRGSTGYAPGISHEHEWDFLLMHDDVTDATRAILRNGVVDPKRVAIMGASFGGYLAVAGVAFESGLYRCAVTECGVFDWERFIKSKSDVSRPGEYERLVDELGKPGRDRERLERISPLEHADQIHVPVLIAHGTEDGVVDVAQSKKLAKELRRRGVPCETFYRAVEGHGFYNYSNRVEFYHRVEAFLAANLGGATLTADK